MIRARIFETAGLFVWLDPSILARTMRLFTCSCSTGHRRIDWLWSSRQFVWLTSIVHAATLTAEAVAATCWIVPHTTTHCRGATAATPGKGATSAFINKRRLNVRTQLISLSPSSVSESSGSVITLPSFWQATDPRAPSPRVAGSTLPGPYKYTNDGLPSERPSAPLHAIRIESLLTDEQAAHCLQLAEEYAAQTGCWNQPDFSRHASYATCDFAVDAHTRLNEYLLHDLDFEGLVLTRLERYYGIPAHELSFLDLFCAHYRAIDDNNNDPVVDDDAAASSASNVVTTTNTIMDRLEAHRDGSLLSFTVLLNPPSQFEGGGTVFDALRDVVPDAATAPVEWKVGGVVRLTRAGDAVLHCGKALHGADAVTRGNRTVLVGFVDVAERCQRPNALHRACRDWGRLDVAQFRYRRQQVKTENGAKAGWTLNHNRWLPRNSRCVARNYCPAFPTVGRRADDEFQRKQRLRAEDMLLRAILLLEAAAADDFGGGIESSSNWPEPFALSGGDITVL